MKPFKQMLLGVVIVASAAMAHASEITVAAAASLSDALAEAGRVFQSQTGDTVRFSFAASSTLTKQIEAGAPVALFFSADEDWMDYVDSRKLLIAATRMDLLGNRLVLIEPADKTAQVDIVAGFPLASLLGSGRLAMGEPGSVPAGKYGKQALVNLGVWESVSSKVVAADSVRSAMAFVQSGEAPFGIVYATDAASSKQVRVAGIFPLSSHKRITYPVAMIKDQDSPEARAFLKFVEGPDGRAIFTKYGFSEP
jgi:molybdate transport system substrate-binding protein